MNWKHLVAILAALTLLAGILRFYRLSHVPPGLYWDEVSIGYNAYSILTTGKDEYGQPLPLLFKAFGEYKLPIYIYATALSMLAFGKTDFAVRFPSALAGTLTVVFTYLLVYEIFKNEKLNIKHQTLNIATAASLLLAISPWHIHFSRAGFEANLSLLFLVSAAVAFLQGVRGRKPAFILSIVLFIAASATYNSARLFAPLLLIALVWIFAKEVKKMKRELAIAAATGVLLITPFIPQFVSGEALARVKSEAIFSEEKPVARFLSNYFANFDTTFLFFRGDQNGRHSVRKLGMLYIFELPLVFLGLRSLLTKSQGKGKAVLISWLLLAPLPSSLTKINPHALRSLNILPSWQIVSALGFVEVVNFIKSKTQTKLRVILAAAASLAILYNLVLYLHQYYVHYPKETALDWQDGTKETVEIIAHRFDQYDQVFVQEALPPLYIAFYLPVAPPLYQRINPEEKIGKITYFKNLGDIQKEPGKTILIVSHWWQKPEAGVDYQEVKMINGDTVFNIWED